MALTEREQLAAKYGEPFMLLWDRFDALDARLNLIQITEAIQMADLSAITSEVQQNGDAVDSAVALLGNLAQQIRDNATDQDALNALAAELDAKGNELAEAVVANTPQQGNEQPTDPGNPEPTPEPTPNPEPTPEPAPEEAPVQPPTTDVAGTPSSGEGDNNPA